MIVTTPPNIGHVPNPEVTKVFLGGCIGGCDDWQKDFIELFEDMVKKPVHLYNPRWDYNWTSTQQITWEFDRLIDSDIIIMWFGKGGMNRIVFYELGMWINSTGRRAFVGVDPEFDRKEDVVIQTKLARPELIIYNNLEDLARAVGKEVDG